ncbi:phospholipase C [Paenibacillus wenxiniae]|uniref:Phospholipase C n=1 Tax=Paenibacillus wenxiniae TaxID=1636843 RepID=A0ABW4RPI6_9BACL
MTKKLMSTPFKLFMVTTLSTTLALTTTSAHLLPLTAKAQAATKQSVSASPATITPIKHVVVLFQENVAFDHYFGTYPYALNPKGEPAFRPASNTPTVNGLSSVLLTKNPNGVNPQRLDRSQALTADMDHSYSAEQSAFNGGKMDQFVKYGGKGSSVVMDYFDGNTVTAMWNYAQHYTLNDNSFGTGYGPSTPGALNLISGQTHGVKLYSANATAHGELSTSQPDSRTITDDYNPYYDKDSTGTTAAMDDTNKNVGDLLNQKGVTWGWFQGGFRNAKEQHKNIGGHTSTDYSPHHQPFQYYKSTSNPNHVAPSSNTMIGKSDRANHQYDMTDFWTAADAGHLPAVSFLKAPMYQDGHAGYSDPIDEQVFLTNTINKLQQLPEWKNTAVIIAYDDSDGWYDHVMPPLVNGSNDPKLDTLNGQGDAGTPKMGDYKGRAGYGPRLPLLIISPYAKKNYVDNTLTDQSSILKFIEDNWQLGRIGDHSMDAVAGTLTHMFDFNSKVRNTPLFLNPHTGEAESEKEAAAQAKQYIAQMYMDVK